MVDVDKHELAICASVLPPDFGGSSPRSPLVSEHREVVAHECHASNGRSEGSRSFGGQR